MASTTKVLGPLRIGTHLPRAASAFRTVGLKANAINIPSKLSMWRSRMTPNPPLNFSARAE